MKIPILLAFVGCISIFSCNLTIGNKLIVVHDDFKDEEIIKLVQYFTADQKDGRDRTSVELIWEKINPETTILMDF